MIEQGPVTARLPFLASLGEAGRLLASTDWAATPLGPVPDWPDELVHAIATCLPSRVPMLLWWSADLVQLYNDAYAGMIGGKHPAAFGQRAAECWAEVWQDLGPLAERVLDGGGATYAEDLCLLLNRFGYEEETYWTFSYSPVHGEDGTALGVFVATTDTTSRVINERRLRVLRALGEISTTEADAGTLMTRAMAVFAGDPQDLPFAVVHEVTGDAAVVLATRGSPAALDLDAVRRVGHGGEAELVGGAAFVQQLEAPAPGRPAVVLTVGLNPHRAFDTGYRTFLELGAARLSTALADADAYRKERRRAEALTELDRAKSEFFANVSHELRTPLTLIAGPAEEALTDAAEPLPAVHRERLGMVLRNADRLRLLVDDLLDFARIEAGRLEPRLRQVDLAALTREIAGSYAPAVERAGLTLRVDCGDAPLPVPVDAGMWEKVVLNLLTNAVKYTFEGSVHVRLTATDGHVELAVADTGIGVPEEELPTLFRRFHRVRGNTGRSHEGAGIGLALVRELAELHGGSVGVSSREGAGSTFRVRLPRTAAVPDEEEPPDAVRRRPGPATPDGARAAPAWSEDQPTAVTAAPATPPADAQTVLVVEDNADLRSFLERLLRPWWHVLVVADGQAALELVRERHPDLVLTDVMMPRLDGMGLLRELRADPATAGIPVLLLSARAGEESAVEGLGAGADDYLAKPFSGPELVARVRSNLELAGLRRRESEFRRALVEAMQDGLAVADADGTVVEVNAAFAEITGYGPEGLPYPWPPPWAIPDLVGDSTPESYRQMLTGAAGDVVVPIRRRDGERVWVSVNIASVTGRHGDRMHVLTVRDVTAERQARRRAAATQSFAAGLAAATTPYDVLVAGATGLAQVFGARRVVTTVRPVEAGLSAEDRSGTTADWPTRVAVGPPPDDEDDGPGTGGGDGAVGESGDEAGAGVGEGAGEGLADGGPVGLEPLVLAAMDSVLGRPGTVAVVPVTGAPGELSTALVAALGSDGAAWLQPAGPGGLTAEDQALFGLLAGHLSQALQRARRLDEARAVSLTLQHAILGPADLPPGFAARYHPAVAPLEVGGDWYDVLRLPTGRIAIVVGDCVGSGLAAAAVMGQLRSACRALLLRGDDPATALRDLDVVAGRTPGAVCTTVFCAVIDPAANLLHYSSAGHLPALVAHPPAPGGTGRAEVLSGGRSLPLGVRPGVRRPGATASLRPGSVLLLFTDGLVERRDRSLDIGLEQAAASFAEHAGLRCGELADRLLADLLPADGGQDDVALLVYRQPPEALRLELAPDPAMLAPLRRRAGSWLALAGLSEVQEHDVVLALTEAASNAVEHGHRDGEPGTVDVTLALEDGRLVVTVTDHGTWRTPEPVPGTRGRGLLMMRAFMDEVTVTPGAGGTTVRMVTALR